MFWEEELKDPARLAMIDGANAARAPPPRNLPPPRFPPLPPLSEVLRQDEEYRSSLGKGRGKGKAAADKKAKKLALKRKRKEEKNSAADGTQVCFAWNRTAKGCVDGKCPNKRAHVCERCGQQHRVCHCKEPKVDNKSG
jgi:hypothetical protein